MKTASLQRYAYTIFCDDLREEVGGKFSLMGIYRNILIPSAPLPISLPHFAAVVHFVEPATEEFKALTIRLYFPGQDENEPPAAQVDIAADQNTAPPETDVPLDRQVRSLAIPFRIAPLKLETAGRLRVRIERDGEVILAGTLQILGGPQETTASGGSSSATEKDSDGAAS
ncbi:hypothetical protein [Phenylobacterium sp.]|uniref:DUF6941 family protein n=1 Tax=Phenylobacterium sp. TaxID=1871053 RepID=UPI0025F66A91|nr:hypothetical protein [Phenylobacterium sp.]MCA3715523.1 hypothetical protein [Phenylobacterium sp.]MCA3740003.1 hypothetical protein [Phenylobacterium sp.]